MKRALRGEEGRQCRFNGRAGTVFGLMLLNWFFIILTLGVYSFWARTKLRQYIISQIDFDGDHFEYHGRGLELLLGALKAFAVLGPLSATLYFLLPLPVGIGVLYLVMALLAPYALYGARRYRMSRLSWRGIRFSFRGRLKECYAIMVPGVFLSTVTLGLYYPHFCVRLQRYWVGHTYFGNTRFRYEGAEQDLFQMYLRYWVPVMLVLAIAAGIVIAVTILKLNPALLVMAQVLGIAAYAGSGLVWLWWRATEQRYHWGHTAFMQGHCYSDLTGGALLVLYLVHALVMAVSVGLAFAWVKVDRVRFQLSRVTFCGFIDFEKIVQELEAARSSATGEGLADALDIGDVDFGVA